MAAWIASAMTFVRSLGALTGAQAVQMIQAGLKTIYVSGWQVAADANLAGQTYPDQSLYPADSAPQLVKRINNALMRADQIWHMENQNGIHWFAPIVADAQLVIVTLDDFEAAETVVSTLHGEYPDIAILARGQSARQCRRMLDLGAKFAVAENLEASVDLAREVLLKDSGDRGKTEALLDSFRREYYRHIDTEADDEARDRKSQA